MSRTFSNAARQALYDPQTAEVFLVLLTIKHPTMADDIRVVNNTQDIVSRGNSYTAFPFDIDLPADDPTRIPRVRLTIDNVGEIDDPDNPGQTIRVVDKLRQIPLPRPTVTIEIVMASAPDTVEAGPIELELQNINYSATTIEGDLVGFDVAEQAFPGDAFNTVDWPGLG